MPIRFRFGLSSQLQRPHLLHRRAMCSVSNEVPALTTARLLVQVRANGFIVFVPKYGIEGPVYLVEKGADAEAAWTMDEVKQTVARADGGGQCVSPYYLH